MNQEEKDKLDALWVEAGHPVCVGMVGEYEDVALHVSRDEVCTSEPDYGAPYSAIPLGDWPPNWEHPTTEHLLMHLAEVAVGGPIEVLRSESGWGVYRSPRQLRDNYGIRASRPELALRIIIEVNKKKAIEQ